MLCHATYCICFECFMMTINEQANLEIGNKLFLDGFIALVFPSHSIHCDFKMCIYSYGGHSLEKFINTPLSSSKKMCTVKYSTFRLLFTISNLLTYSFMHVIIDPNPFRHSSSRLSSVFHISSLKITLTISHDIIVITIK